MLTPELLSAFTSELQKCGGTVAIPKLPGGAVGGGQFKLKTGPVSTPKATPGPAPGATSSSTALTPGTGPTAAHIPTPPSVTR
jgi:hypothetical protein